MNSKSIYDYANEKDSNKHISFSDVFNTLLNGIDCVVCLESAADLLGYSNGGFRAKIKIYTEKDYDLPYLECHKVEDITKIPHEENNGIKVMTIEKTIIDLLENEDSDDQVILETFANYYFENNNFSKIDVPSKLIDKFNYYKEEGIKYYNSN